MIVIQDKLGQAKIFMNFNYLRFLWKPTHFRLGTISENVCIGDFYQCAKFHACIKKCTIHLKFGAKALD